MIRVTSVLAATALAAFLSQGTALAGEAVKGAQYSSDDIVKFFQAQADLGAARGICVGTVEECEQNQPKPAGFDMLINFELDSAKLTEQARQNLAAFAKALKDDRLAAANFVVEGYTDASGGESYNKGLSERRAESVTAFLLENGVPAARLEAVGMGEGRPRVSDPYSGENRRVEMRVRVQ